MLKLLKEPFVGDDEASLLIEFSVVFGSFKGASSLQSVSPVDERGGRTPRRRTERDDRSIRETRLETRRQGRKGLVDLDYEAL